MNIVDTKGKPCPAPLIATKRALKEAKTGDAFQVLTDNQTSLENLCRFLKDNHTDFSVKGDNGDWEILVTKRNSGFSEPEVEEYCRVEIPHFSHGNFIIAFSSDKMGLGDDDLGSLLMANFIKAITDLDILPGKMVFYNRGVLLGTADSPVSGHLAEIEKMGVELFLCATCVKHYSLEEKIKVGSLSNMFEIARLMASASNIIKP